MKRDSHTSIKIAFAAVFAIFSLLMTPAGLIAGAEPLSDLKKKIFLSLKTEKLRAYENEKIALTITLYNDGLSVRDVEYPQFRRDGFSSGELGTPVQKTQILGGITYNTLEFTTFIIPKKTGDLTLGPAGLHCTILVQSTKGGVEAFFGAQEAYALDVKSEEATVKILPLPKEGRPADFHGAVGRFEIAVTVHPREVKAGDPVKVTTAITGSGNVNDLRCPSSEMNNTFKLYPPRLIQKDATTICEQILIPRAANVNTIPPIRFSFFNPETESYTTINKGPFAVTVTGPTVATNPEAKDEGNGYPDDAKRRWGLILLLMSIPAVFLALLIVVYQQRVIISGFIREKVQRFQKAKRREKAIREAEKSIDKGDVEKFYTIIFRTLQDSLGDAFHLHHAAITADIIAGVLQPKGIHEDMVEKINTIFTQCDRARYASFSFERETMKETFAMTKDVVRYLHQFH